MQVATEFEDVGAACNIRCVCVYGGAAFSPQESALRRGVHVVIGTPGRIQDHIDRGNLKMDKLRCARPSTLKCPSTFSPVDL